MIEVAAYTHCRLHLETPAFAGNMYVCTLVAGKALNGRGRQQFQDFQVQDWHGDFRGRGPGE